MKEGGELLGLWIAAGQIWAFGKIASTAAEGKIVEGCSALVLASDDVIQNMGKARQLFWQAAILA